MVQDEAAKDEVTRRNEQQAWNFIRQEQHKRALKSCVLGSHSGRDAETGDVELPTGAAAVNEEADLLRAGIVVSTDATMHTRHIIWATFSTENHMGHLLYRE
jgi:hypothetical protein